jgi:hypothetical protein
MSRRAIAVATLGLSLAIVAPLGCGSASSPTSDPAAGTGGGAGGTSGKGGAGGGSAGKGGGSAAGAAGAAGVPGNGGSGVILGCVSPCGTDEICSVTGQCIAKETCAAAGDCGAGLTCDMTTKTCVPGSMCGSEEIVADLVPPNVLVVLDRSCSMKKASGGKPKWTIAVDAITGMTTSFSGKARFGITLFPDITGDECTQDAIPIPPAAGTEAAIQKLLQDSLQSSDAYYPDGPCVTNIDTGVEQASKAPALDDTDRASFLVLITDGKQAGCSLAGGDTGTTKLLSDLYQQRHIVTFVVGFVGEIDPAQMNTFAEAGGAPIPNSAAKYYAAEDQASLDQALAAIAKKTLGCTYKLTHAPPDPEKLFVFFDNTTEVPRDPSHMAGWDYDASKQTVTIYGSYCQDLETAKVTDLDIVFGCNVPSPG